MSKLAPATVVDPVRLTGLAEKAEGFDLGPGNPNDVGQDWITLRMQPTVLDQGVDRRSGNAKCAGCFADIHGFLHSLTPCKSIIPRKHINCDNDSLDKFT